MDSTRLLFVWVLRGLALIMALGLLVLVGLAVWTIQRHDIRLFSVASGSMEPMFAVGDAVIVAAADFSQLSAGDVVSYRSAATGSTITHRIRSIDRQERQLVTQGDANEQSDGIIAASQLSGRAVAVAPQLGKLAAVLQSPAGLMALVYLPATVWIVYELHRLQYRLQKPYKLAGR